ncbi:MAG: alpha/beta hydrolase [Caldilinea sp.]|nr:alpha/beta hydrolase [Caldilinea sp.]MCB0056642.1 alpha/beta hydrolase [Caldilineaceae bacterium]MCB0137366.1 alpha/beta hydrolase [Caldilineaceae bacterium]MCB9122283.1 alpha/beta hydrolase [Caldilineaceae bacterium]MCO5211078.1 alpha/beta hydrolase [Caldilinea sp.]
MTTTSDFRVGYAPVNGVGMYYEVHGAGAPLILIHGGFGVTGMFAPLLPALAAQRQVIAVELQGFGHTADIDRPFRYEYFADDIAALIDHLGLEQADVLGYSLGGGVALQAVIRHPDVVRKVVVVSAPFRRDGWYADVLAGMAALDAGVLGNTPLYEIYAAVAPTPANFPHLVEKTRQLLSTPYDWGNELAALAVPALLVMADADSFPPSHAAEMFALLGGGQRDAGWEGRERPASQLAILPGATHYDILTHTDLLLPILAAFLATPLPDRA